MQIIVVCFFINKYELENHEDSPVINDDRYTLNSVTYTAISTIFLQHFHCYPLLISQMCFHAIQLDLHHEQYQTIFINREHTIQMFKISSSIFIENKNIDVIGCNFFEVNGIVHIISDLFNSSNENTPRLTYETQSSICIFAISDTTNLGWANYLPFILSQYYKNKNVIVIAPETICNSLGKRLFGISFINGNDKLSLIKSNISMAVLFFKSMTATAEKIKTILTLEQFKLMDDINKNTPLPYITRKKNLSIKTIYAHRNKIARNLGFQSFNEFCRVFIHSRELFKLFISEIWS